MVKTLVKSFLSFFFFFYFLIECPLLYCQGLQWFAIWVSVRPGKSIVHIQDVLHQQRMQAICIMQVRATSSGQFLYLDISASPDLLVYIANISEISGRDNTSTE